MKRNVLELTGSFQQGGSERQAVQLSRLLNGDGRFRVFVGCLDRSGDLKNEIDWLESDAIPEFKLTSFYDVDFIRQVARCARFIQENEISVVHTHDFYTNIFGMCAAFWAGVPARVASKRETFSKTGRQMMMERQAFRLADRIVANAVAVRKFLIDAGVPGGKIDVIHNGLDLERLTPAVCDREAILNSFRIPISPTTKVVTIVANMSSEVKNHRMFLRAAKRVNDVVPGTVFVLAGEGELERPLRSVADELGITEKVVFTGRCRNVAELLSVTDVCVLSSRSEGFSNSILEYMSARKPVVATRVGGAEEVVIDDQTGFLVESDDDETMADRIALLLRDRELSTRFGKRGREMIESEFTLEQQLSKTLELYEGLLSQKIKSPVKQKVGAESRA